MIPKTPALTGLLALLLPLLAAGNSVIGVTSERAPFAGLALGEICASSDVPAGAVNLLAGLRSELAPQLALHRDIDGLLIAGKPEAALTEAAADNMKRVRFCDLKDAEWAEIDRLRALSWVEPFVEVKSFWHPVAP